MLRPEGHLYTLLQFLWSSFKFKKFCSRLVEGDLQSQEPYVKISGYLVSENCGKAEILVKLLACHVKVTGAVSVRH